MGPRRARRWQVVLLGAVALVSSVNSLQGQLVFDDQRAVVDNRCVTKQPTPQCAFSSDFWGRPAGEVGRSYRPLVVLTFALDWWLGDGKPTLFHLGNLALHVACTLALFALVSALARGRHWDALWPALLFAVLAVHSEAVASVVGRADLMVTLFTLLALLCHLRAEQGGGRVFRLLMIVLFALGLMSHELGILLPVWVVLLDWVRHGRGLLRRGFSTYLLLACCALLYVGARWWLLGHVVGPPPEVLNNPAVAAGPSGRVLFAAESVSRALGLMLAPIRLSAEYGFAAVTVPTGLTAGAALGVLTATVLALATLGLRQRLPALALGGGLLLSGLLLVSNGPVLMPTAFAERLLYLPSVGLALLLGGGLSRWANSRAWCERCALVLLGLLMAGNLVLRWKGVAAWADPVQLFSQAVQAQPQSARAQLNLGLALNEDGQHAAAVAPLRRALHIVPQLVTARVELAMAYDLTGQPGRAYQAFSRALYSAPGSCHVAHNFARFLMRHRRAAVARDLLQRHLALRPGDRWAKATLRRLRQGRPPATSRGK